MYIYGVFRRFWLAFCSFAYWKRIGFRGLFIFIMVLVVISFVVRFGFLDVFVFFGN